MPAFGGRIGESRKRSDDIYIIVQNSRRDRESVVHSGLDIGNRFSLVCPINTARDRDGFGLAILEFSNPALTSMVPQEGNTTAK